MIDTIIFDNEGVIADTEPAWDKEQEIFLGRRGIKYNKERTKHLLSGKSIPDGVRILKKEYNLTGDEIAMSEERYAIIKKLLETDVYFVEGFMDFYRLVKLKYKTCIATSMDEDLLKILDRQLKLSELFRGSIYTLKQVQNKSKPCPDIFLYAANKLNSRPGNCIVIEDSPNGIEAAINAGMKCIGLATTYTGEKLKNADLIVKSFDEIDLNRLG
ncbi:MAG: HAD family phosphatase [Bacteroidales bacterium]|nr:MAG: HAD family phosphatase [Bacteroidales bacterium]